MIRIGMIVSLDTKCTVIPLCELEMLIKQRIDDLPVWIEYRSDDETVIEATVIQDYIDNEHIVTLSGTYDISHYAIDWRLWYAYGAERPIANMPWSNEPI